MDPEHQVRLGHALVQHLTPAARATSARLPVPLFLALLAATSACGPGAPWEAEQDAWREAALAAGHAALDAERVRLASPPVWEELARRRAALADAALRMETPPLSEERHRAWWELRAREEAGDAAGVAAATARIATLERDASEARAALEALLAPARAAEERLAALRALPARALETQAGERCPTCHLGMAERRAALVAPLGAALPPAWAGHPGGVPAGRCTACHGGDGTSLALHGLRAAP